MALDELIDRFLARLRGEVGVSPHTYAAYADDLARFAAFVRARFRIDDAHRVSREVVLALRASKGMVLDSADHDTWSAGSFFTTPVVSDDRVPAVLWSS